MFHYSLCSEHCEVDFARDMDADMELSQRTSDLKWANQFIHKYIMQKISVPEKWLRRENFSVCFYFFFWRLTDIEALVPELGKRRARILSISVLCKTV